MVGNSLTTSNDMPTMLASLLEANVVMHARGGAQLSEFSNPKTRLGAKTLSALEAGGFDFVVMQEMSHLPASNPQAHMRNVAKLAELVRTGGATPVLYGTWGYAPTCKKLEKLGLSHKEMQDAMRASLVAAAKATNVVLADAGTAFQATDPEGTSLFAPDGVHPSPAGSALAARVIADAIQEHLGSSGSK